MKRSEFNHIRNVALPNLLEGIHRAEDPADERRLNLAYAQLNSSIEPYKAGREALEEDLPTAAPSIPRVALRAVPLTSNEPIRLGRRSTARPFLAGFTACYLLASFCLSLVAYASQPMTARDAAAIGPRWPLTLSLLFVRAEWLRERPPAACARAE